MAADDRESKLLSPQEKVFVDRLAAHYAPAPMTPAQRVVFDRILEERIARRAGASFFRPATLVATTCAAFLIWLIIPYRIAQPPHEVKQPGTLMIPQESPMSSESEA